MPSASIRKTEYDPESRILSVWFVASGKRYEFEGVPPETFAAFKAAFAKGRYFNDHIRNNFRYRLVASDSTMNDLIGLQPNSPCQPTRCRCCP
ncbi:KTSC domain-containing protein [Mesorhizobium sp. M0571]|uniref:KTSC domain-containing protein n=1 Tax=Mesorhizobium sp. M0571 TaxID=2956960 RepID=UPI00333E06AF